MHLIKIDVEGMEVDVLRGAIGTIERCSPKLLVEAATAQALQDVEAVLRPLGYRKIKVYNETPTYLFEAKFADAYPEKRIQAIDPMHVAALPPTEEIVAGMATVAGNEVALRATVMSLLPQVDRLYVYLNGFTEAPRFIAEHPKIRHFIDTDGSRYGDAGKFWGWSRSRTPFISAATTTLSIPMISSPAWLASWRNYEGKPLSACTVRSSYSRATATTRSAVVPSSTMSAP